MLKKIYFIFLQIIGLFGIFNIVHMARFLKLHKRYEQLYQMSSDAEDEAKGRVGDFGTYDWGDWKAKIRRDLETRVPLSFLRLKPISDTMVYSGTGFQEQKVSTIRPAYAPERVSLMLKECLVGAPKITDLRYRTSANTIHQAHHISAFKNALGFDLSESTSVIEWGGGYGCLARIVKVLNPDITYIIADLAEMSALQHFYLSVAFGSREVCVCGKWSDVKKGKINLISSDVILFEKSEVSCQTFISNWALTESAREYQEKVLATNFFDAENVMISCVDDNNNFVIRNSSCSFDSRSELEFLGPGNFYLMARGKDERAG